MHALREKLRILPYHETHYKSKNSNLSKPYHPWKSILNVIVVNLIQNPPVSFIWHIRGECTPGTQCSTTASPFLSSHLSFVAKVVRKLRRCGWANTSTLTSMSYSFNVYVLSISYKYRYYFMKSPTHVKFVNSAINFACCYDSNLLRLSGSG